MKNLVHDWEVILSSSLILSQAENHFGMELNFPVAIPMRLGQFFVECFVSLSHCSQKFQESRTSEAGSLGVAMHSSQVSRRTSGLC